MDLPGRSREWREAVMNRKYGRNIVGEILFVIKLIEFRFRFQQSLLKLNVRLFSIEGQACQLRISEATRQHRQTTFHWKTGNFPVHS